jgi:hypothetical protein
VVLGLEAECLRMDKQAPSAHITPDFRALAHTLARYRDPDCVRGALEVTITAGPFAIMWVLMWASLDAGY